MECIALFAPNSQAFDKRGRGVEYLFQHRERAFFRAATWLVLYTSCPVAFQIWHKIHCISITVAEVFLLRLELTILSLS